MKKMMGIPLMYLPMVMTMNKEKVNKLIDSIDSGLNDIEEDQQPVMQALTEYVRADVRDLKEEFNSKPVMPKLFDNWRKKFTVSQESSYLAIESLNQEVTAHTLGYATILGTWINNDFDKRYQTCIEAILYGYEVEN